MESLQTTATRALTAMLAAQPPSQAKVAFAWQIAAGATMARASTVTWSDGTLRVRTGSATWRREIVRAKPMLLDRLRHLVGAETVRSLIIEKEEPGIGNRERRTGNPEPGTRNQGF
jgi:hypothetical protein